jgi:phage head maturation protease
MTEIRTLQSPVEIRTAETSKVLVGYAAKFNAPSVELRTASGRTFTEVIAPGAFRNLAAARVRATFEHKPEMLLGTTWGGTLVLRGG